MKQAIEATENMLETSRVLWKSRQEIIAKMSESQISESQSMSEKKPTLILMSPHTTHNKTSAF